MVLESSISFENLSAKMKVSIEALYYRISTITIPYFKMLYCIGRESKFVYLRLKYFESGLRWVFWLAIPGFTPLETDKSARMTADKGSFTVACWSWAGL